jgi:3alpha(or 20beta)-hydroxysteroid dehydrogenase
MIGRVADKVVVITGAARGQGAAGARALAAEGANVVATDIVAPNEVPPGELDGYGEAIVYRQLDVADRAAWTVLAAELKQRYGQINGLVNNAGVTRWHTPSQNGRCARWRRLRAWSWDH